VYQQYQLNVRAASLKITRFFEGGTEDRVPARHGTDELRSDMETEEEEAH